MATKYKRGKIWHVSWTDKRTGRRIRESTGLTDKESAERLRRHYEAEEKAFRLHGTPLQRPIRFDDFRAEYLLIRTNRKAFKTLEADRNALNSLQKAIGNPYLDRITVADMEKWYDSILSTRSVATANTYFRHIRTFFNSAVGKKYLSESPCKIDLAQEPESQIRILSENEVARLLDIMPNAWQNITRIALYTGARLSELIRLKKSDVDLLRGCVTIHSTNDNPTKTKRFRVIPVPDVSLDLFRELRSGSDPLLKTANGHAWKRDWVSHGFVRYAKKARIECSFHDLRKTYGAWLVMNGADLVTVKENMGHSDISVTIKHYVHLMMEHKKKQVNRLPCV